MVQVAALQPEPQSVRVPAQKAAVQVLVREPPALSERDRRCREAGLPEPEFRLDGGCFVLTIRRKTAQVTTQVAGQVSEQDKMFDQSMLEEVAAALSMPTTQVTTQVAQALSAVAMEPQPRDKMQTAAGLANREHFRKAYLDPLVTAGWLSRTIPDKPTSRLQKYRLTEKGRAWLRKARPRVRRSPKGEDV